MDVFFDTLPFERKYRTHFHRFMQRVHKQLKVLSGEKNPLDIVANDLAKQYRVICFDEFFVSDIADAMILGGLFEKLFARGVSLMATSNIVPDNLYRDGLQRSRFLPAIAALKEHTRVLNVDGGIDYRLRALQQAELYYTPLGDGAEESLIQCFDRLAPEQGSVQEDVSLEVEGRILKARRCCDDVVWFDFKELCDGPRSQNDYIELAKVYHAVILSDVPQMSVAVDDQARRFINLVDEFYDRNVKLVISAQVGLTNLYSGGKLAFEFERTQSRLLEMQSTEFLARPHKP
jgi:cell division protein ZapE